MLPLSVYCGKILLQVHHATLSLTHSRFSLCFQTAPEHVLPLLDKSLREVITIAGGILCTVCVLCVCVCLQVASLDGVLELKGEHFWTIAFGSYVSKFPNSDVIPISAHSLGWVSTCEGQERCQ